MSGLEYLLNIVPRAAVFKVCLDYWHALVCDLYQATGTAWAAAGAWVSSRSRRLAGRGGRVEPTVAVRREHVAAAAAYGEPHG